jgi:hypothetical protein
MTEDYISLEEAKKRKAERERAKKRGNKEAAPKSDADVAAAIDRLNKSFAYIEARPDMVLQTDWNHPTGGATRMLAIKDFRTLLENDRIEVLSGNGLTLVPASKLWLASKRRNQWRDADYFGPNEPVPKRFLNLYRGLAVTPKPGSWDKLRRFLKEIVCAGSQTAYDYLVDLMRWKVQNPTKPTEIALVLLGKPGVGKGTFAYIFRLIFGGEHFIHFTDPVQAQNKFNTLLMGRFVAFYDESFYGHDPRIKQKLKGYITEPVITIEQKYATPFQTRNIPTSLPQTRSPPAHRRRRPARRRVGVRGGQEGRPCLFRRSESRDGGRRDRGIRPRRAPRRPERV